MALSRNKRRKLNNLVYRVVAATYPDAEIEQDPLHRRYPDTNYTVSVYLSTEEEAKDLLRVLKEALGRRSFKLGYPNIWLNPHKQWVLDVGHYYELEGS